MKKQFRSLFISLFVILWIIIFHYESLRYFYLSPLFGQNLPKLKLLFPPAGWIMFYNVDDSAGFVEVYGSRDKELFLIDPHDIFATRTIGFDNIHRNILSAVADPSISRQFCKFLNRKFPYYDRFIITTVYYPSLTKQSGVAVRQVKYQCSDSR